jgi:ABC-type multidrug transport system fused ATPase/permease subunit
MRIPLQTEAVRTFSDTAIYVLFALKVSELPLSETGISMASLSFIQSAARGLAGSLYRFVREVQSFGSEFASFRAYYRVMEVKSAIAEPPKPREYAKITRTEKGETREGMEIEFRDVYYRWPGKKENVGFGQVHAVVRPAARNPDFDP